MLTNMPRPVDNSVDNSMIDLKRSLSFLACRIDKCLGYVIEYKHTEKEETNESD